MNLKGLIVAVAATMVVGCSSDSLDGQWVMQSEMSHFNCDGDTCEMVSIDGKNRRTYHVSEVDDRLFELSSGQSTYTVKLYKDGWKAKASSGEVLYKAEEAEFNDVIKDNISFSFKDDRNGYYAHTQVDGDKVTVTSVGIGVGSKRYNKSIKVGDVEEFKKKFDKTHSGLKTSKDFGGDGLLEYYLFMNDGNVVKILSVDYMYITEIKPLSELPGPPEGYKIFESEG